MRRNAVCLSASLLIILAVSGCKSFGKKDTESQSMMDSTDTYALAAQESTYEPQAYPVYGSPTPVESGFEPPQPATVVAPRQHVVVKHDTLYGLARMYYNDQRRWKDIYEANSTVISDPNRIRVGQRLVIP